MTKNLFVLVFAFFFIGCSEASLGFKAIDQDTCVESCDEGTLLSEEPILYPTAFEIKESQAQDVACARVLDSANKVLNSNVYCDAKHVGKVCNYAFNLERSVCNKADKIWYQKAIDEASDLYQNDPTSHPKVKLSAGTIKLEYLLPAHWPYGDYIGIHLKEGVSLEGTSYESFQTNIRLSKNILKDVDSEQPLIQDRVLRAMILVAKNRIYQSPKETVLSETQNNQIYDLTLSGHFGGDINCRSLAEQEIGVESGILAAGVNQIAIRNVQAYHFSGNILEMGLYLPWVKEDHLCNGISCLGKRMWVKGSSSNPAIISKNHLCDGKFGGIVLVGQEAKISDNTIQYIHQAWNTETQTFGVTMGISASFAGSKNIVIEGNQIEGGDYGIGTDGSFPLALTVGLFSAYSQDIENELGAEVMSRYPNGVVHQGIVQLEGEDYVRGQQVLLNLASRQAVQRKDESGFGENINIVNNQILNSIMGISLYRVKQSYVWKNQIESLSKGYVGVGVSDSYSIPIFENYIKNWNKGVWIVGSPQGNSEWGSSFIGMGAKPPVFSSLNRWEDVGNILVNNIWSIAIENAGYDNAVRSNQISSTEGQGQCLFINAKTTNPSMDWTTFNSDPSCNN